MHSIVMGRIAMLSLPSASVMTTGRLTTASRSRIATCGWLMIGVAASAPYWPGFVIVNVPPRTSSGCSSRSRARRGRGAGGGAGGVADAAAEPLVGEVLRVADDRHDEPVVGERDGDAEVDLVVAGEGVALEPRVEVGELAQRLDDAARDDRQRRRPDRGPAALDRAHVALDDRRAVGGDLERALHVLADRLAHTRERLTHPPPPRRPGRRGGG